MTTHLPLACLLAALALSGCTDMAPPASDTDRAALGRDTPENAPPGSCWDKTVTPAVVETATQNVLVQPAQISASGTVQSPPIYRTETRQRIVTPRRETWFQMPCPADLTPVFLASVQRALTARGYYAGPITSTLDPATRAAVARYQAAEAIAAPQTGALTVPTAQKLGLWAVSRAELARTG